MTLRASCLLHAPILCGILILGSSPLAGQADRTKQFFDREDADLAKEVTTHSFRGAVLVGVDGKIIFERAMDLPMKNGEYGILPQPSSESLL